MLYKNININDSSKIIDNITPASNTTKAKDISIGAEIYKNGNYILIGYNEKDFLIDLLKNNFDQLDIIDQFEDLLYSDIFDYIEIVQIGNRIIKFSEKNNNTICSNYNWLPKKLSINIILDVTKNINIINEFKNVNYINMYYKDNKIFVQFQMGEKILWK